MTAAAARVEDPIAHSHAGLGTVLGALAGVAAGALLVGAAVASGGTLLIVAAVGGAAGLTSFGGLKGMAIGGAIMGAPCGELAIGSPNVLVNGRPATMTAIALADCHKDSGPIPLATGSATVAINAGLAGREGETLACSAKVVAPCSPNVFIGGPSAPDPRVAITPEVPGWAVSGLQTLGVAGAIMALPYSLATMGIAGTVAIGLLGAGGSYVGGKGMRALGQSLGMSPAGVLTMEALGELGGGMAGGRLGVGGVRQGRYSVAREFYQKQGMPDADIPSHLNGIDLNRPVKVVTLKQNTPVEQYQVPGGRQGTYYTPPGTPATKLGINPRGTDYATGAVVDKTPKTYTTTRDVQVLRSTAAPVKDFWSVKGQTVQTEGGGTQYFSMDRGSFGP